MQAARPSTLATRSAMATRREERWGVFTARKYAPGWFGPAARPRPTTRGVRVRSAAHVRAPFPLRRRRRAARRCPFVGRVLAQGSRRRRERCRRDLDGPEHDGELHDVDRCRPTRPCRPTTQVRRRPRRRIPRTTSARSVTPTPSSPASGPPTPRPSRPSVTASGRRTAAPTASWPIRTSRTTPTRSTTA